MTHGCRALVVNCMDFRFQTAVRAYMLEHGLEDDYDYVGLAGSGKALSHDNEAERELLIKQVSISRKQHNISQVYLFQHLDCAGFGGQAAFSSQEIERERMHHVLHEAKLQLECSFPGVKVICVLAAITQDKGKPPDRYVVSCEQLDT